MLAVSLGVALVQSSLLLLISAATLDAPPGLTPLQRMEFDEHTLVAVTVLAVTLGVAAFLAVFVISSTFAFTVAQRRRDLALLRLTGASPRQVRHLLMGQAVLLGVLGVAGGVPLGAAVMRVQERLLDALDFVPAGFQGQWRAWTVLVSAGTGIGLACAGVLAAARRAARIRPLEALRDTAVGHRSLSRSRRAAGTLLLLAALALIALAPAAGPAGGQAMAMCVSLCAVLAFACFGPRLVPALGRLLPLRSSATVGLLAKAGLRDDPWRSASTAAPVVVLAGLLLGQSAALTSASAAARQVLTVAWLETSALAAIGLLLGALATAGTLVAMAATSASVSGSAVVGVPWNVAGAVALTVLLVTSLTALVSAWSATRPTPVSLLTART
ncbi:FtsX-like permease family protein [Streptomyces griseosporeus]|uniref:FtsX-like permease family protein n=1 Tax=Streptomyces griseosporeus TaxID=1910 RepID=UPI0036FBC022